MAYSFVEQNRETKKRDIARVHREGEAWKDLMRREVEFFRRRIDAREHNGEGEEGDAAS